MVHVGLRLDSESLLTHQTRRSAARLCCARSWTWSHRIDRSRGELGARARCAKDIDRTAVTTAPATRIDAMRVIAGNDASAFALTAPRKSASLARWALRIHRATHGSMRGSIVWAVCVRRLAPCVAEGTKSQTTRVRRCANADKGLLITVERGPCGFLRSKSIFQLLRNSNY